MTILSNRSVTSAPIYQSMIEAMESTGSLTTVHQILKPCGSTNCDSCSRRFQKLDRILKFDMFRKELGNSCILCGELSHHSEGKVSTPFKMPQRYSTLSDLLPVTQPQSR